MEKLISLDSGSDMLALQALMFFVEIPSIPVVFTLDFSSFVYFHGRLVESRNVVHSQILKKLKKTLRCVSISSGARTLPMYQLHLHHSKQ